MKNIFLAVIISVALFACKQENQEKILTPRNLKAGESFNEIPQSDVNVFNVVKIDSGEKDQYQIKYRDTLICVKKDPKPLANKFLNPKFLNSQNTAILVQVADGSGLVSPFYILAVCNGKLEAVELDRPSTAKSNLKITKGIEELNRSSFLVNNDFLVTTVNGKVYPIKRRVDNERIYGKIFMVSRDASTLIFLTENSFYQYNYLTGETFNQLINPKILHDKKSLYETVQRNYSWFKSAKGIRFLKENAEDNRIVDIKEFKH